MTNKTVLRTIKVPVAEIIEGGTKNDFYTDLREILHQCRSAYNLSLSLCCKKDLVNSLSTIIKDKKVPKTSKTYNYEDIKHLFPGASQVAASIDRMAITKYRQQRWGILRGTTSLPIQRSCPLPILHNKSSKTFSLEVDEQNNILLHITLLNHNKYTLKLRGGSNYKRQLDCLRFVIETEKYGDSKIWINKKNVATVGITCTVPVKQNKLPSKKASVTLNKDNFVSVVRPQDNIPFNITGDQVKKWQSERKRKQERFNQDRKSGSTRKYMTKIQNRVSEKYRNRLKTFINQTTMQIVKHLIRNKITIVEYNDVIKSYFGRDFPYYEFGRMLEDKCILNGIEFVKCIPDVIPAEEDEPHVYFMISIINNKPDGRIKIGKTTQGKKRKRNLETAGGHNLVLLATDKQTKSKLTAREKHYHALFEKDRLEGQKEWFKSKNIIKYLRETGMFGNTGNQAEISQYINV
jgi:transposase